MTYMWNFVCAFLLGLCGGLLFGIVSQIWLICKARVKK